MDIREVDLRKIADLDQSLVVELAEAKTALNQALNGMHWEQGHARHRLRGRQGFKWQKIL